MERDINFLLIGNTRLHWAETSQKNYIYFHTDRKNIPKNINLDSLIWASVGKLPDVLLKQENEIKTKDIKLKNLPHYFGVDRAFGCLEALKIVENPFHKNLLIADFGTTLTLTKLTSKGSVIGGQILPGFLTQLRALENYTENLNTPKTSRIPDQNFLIKTEDSILKGVSNSLIGVINLSFDSKKDILIMCGGDAELISGAFKKKNKEIIIAPNLVMQGMISHCKDYNNQLKPKSEIM